jgi:hypothetical protein
MSGMAIVDRRRERKGKNSLKKLKLNAMVDRIREINK